MKNEFTLRVVLSETMHANLTAYANRTGLSLSNITRCCLVAGLDGEGTPGELAEELDKLIARLQARRDALRPKAAGEGEAGEGEVRE